MAIVLLVVLMGVCMDIDVYAENVNASETAVAKQVAGQVNNSTDKLSGYVVLGDSRCCGLIVTLLDDKDAVCLYDFLESPRCDGVFLKDGKLLIICSESGGYYRSGAYNRTMERAIKLANRYANEYNVSSYATANLFAFNDLFLDGESSAITAPSNYVRLDKELRYKIKNCSKVYQFNAGPVSETGSVYMNGGPSNALIANYNSGFNGTDYVSVVDLYGYLMSVGYDALDNDVDDTGIHYDHATNKKIIDLIYTLQ